MIRITGIVDGARVTLAEFHHELGCARACRNGRHEERRARLKAERRVLQSERKKARSEAFASGDDSGIPITELPAPPADLTEGELVELAAWTPSELSGMSPLPEPMRQGQADPERDEKTAAKLIANTAMAYEQNGLAREVRIEVHS